GSGARSRDRADWKRGKYGHRRASGSRFSRFAQRASGRCRASGVGGRQDLRLSRGGYAHSESGRCLSPRWRWPAETDDDHLLSLLLHRRRTQAVYRGRTKDQLKTSLTRKPSRISASLGSITRSATLSPSARPETTWTLLISLTPVVIGFQESM